MSESEAREAFKAALRQHAQDLDADDLRSIAADLERTADKWEASAL